MISLHTSEKESMWPQKQMLQSQLGKANQALGAHVDRRSLYCIHMYNIGCSRSLATVHVSVSTISWSACLWLLSTLNSTILEPAKLPTHDTFVKDFAFMNFVRRSPICQLQSMRLGPRSLKTNFASQKNLGIVLQELCRVLQFMQFMQLQNWLNLNPKQFCVVPWRQWVTLRFVEGFWKLTAFYFHLKDKYGFSPPQILCLQIWRSCPFCTRVPQQSLSYLRNCSRVWRTRS